MQVGLAPHMAVWMDLFHRTNWSSFGRSCCRTPCQNSQEMLQWLQNTLQLKNALQHSRAWYTRRHQGHQLRLAHLRCRFLRKEKAPWLLHWRRHWISSSCAVASLVFERALAAVGGKRGKGGRGRRGREGERERGEGEGEGRGRGERGGRREGEGRFWKEIWREQKGLEELELQGREGDCKQQLPIQGKWGFFDSERPFLGWWEMGVFWLRNPLFPILGILFGPCKGQTRS